MQKEGDVTKHLLDLRHLYGVENNGVCVGPRRTLSTQ